MKCIILSILLSVPLILAACGSDQAEPGDAALEESPDKDRPANVATPPAKASGPVKTRGDEDAGDTAPATDKPRQPPVRASQMKDEKKTPSTAGNLLDPSSLTARAPDEFKVKFKTTNGDFVIEVLRFWSPRGADRFYNLAKSGYFKDVAFFRVLDGFVAQFGLHGDPKVNRAWRGATIQDDEVKQRNQRGTIVFAKSGQPNTRSVQFFINFKDNFRLDEMGFSPFGRVVEGMDVVDSLHSGYGEGAPQGRGPSQGQITQEGNAYLKRDFPNLDYIRRAEVEE